MLVYAHHKDATHDAEGREWVESRIPKVFAKPSPLAAALEFAEQLRGRPNCERVAPGRRHWDIFCGLCVKAGAKGNFVPDAYFARGQSSRALSG